jgi:TM2 domain-containing membrane protein YozV
MTDDLFASPKSRLTAQLLAVFLGVFGAHRFYAGKTQTGVLQALTLGGLGLWYLYDNIMIAAGSFRDGEGLLIANWEPETERLITPGTAAAIFDELDTLRAEVTELHDRLAFTERLLGQAARGETDRS